MKEIRTLCGTAIRTSRSYKDGEHLVVVDVASSKPDAKIPLYMAKHSEYYDDAWHILGVFFSEADAQKFIDEHKNTMRKKHGASICDIDNCASYTIQGVELHT